MNAQMEGYALEHASLRARLLRATAGFSTDEIEDARQELLIDCVRRAPNFDSKRGDWGGFVRGVMRNQATVLVIRRQRRVRHEVLAGNLEPECESPRDFFQIAAHDDEADGLDLSLDVRRVLGQLPDHLRTLAYLVPQMRVTEICAVTGKSRSRVYQMIGQIRAAFIEAGLGPRSGGCE
jgi:DNA-directed RNA polymerase specialized sigma24 family protein